jgi:hypothetical protein
VITGFKATSLWPHFVTDRNGIENGATEINSTYNIWKLPVDTYFQGDTTVTMWVKRIGSYIGCLGSGTYGNQFK